MASAQALVQENACSACTDVGGVKTVRPKLDIIRQPKVILSKLMLCVLNSPKQRLLNICTVN